MSTTSVCDQIALYLGGALPFRSLHKEVSIPVDIITVCLCTVSRDYLFMQWNMRRVHSLSYCSLSSLLSSFISIWLQILYAKILQHFFYSMDPGQNDIIIMTSSISNRKIFNHSSFLVMYVQYIINLYIVYIIYYLVEETRAILSLACILPVKTQKWDSQLDLRNHHFNPCRSSEPSAQEKPVTFSPCAHGWTPLLSEKDLCILRSVSRESF